MNPRWILLPLAALCVASALWIKSHGRTVSPELLLESARVKLAAQPADRQSAARDLEEALILARRPEQAGLRAAILDERSRLLAAGGFLDLALADCRLRLDEFGPDADTLVRASDLALWINEPTLALEFAQQLVALDPLRGQTRIGRARVALADVPLAALESLARNALPPSIALQVRGMSQRAAVYADDRHLSSASLDGLLEFFTRPDERRQAEEWVREASEHMRAARTAFVASLAPGTTNEAVAGLQDLLLRAGALREAADLGTIALSILKNPNLMPVLSRTTSALSALERNDEALALILDIEARDPSALRHQVLPSYALRDELQEWCLLLERLGAWSQLRPAAYELAYRSRDDNVRNQLAFFLAATAELRLNQPANALRALDGVSASPVADFDLPVRSFLLRAEIARRQVQKNQERYSLLQATKAAPLDPAPPLRAQIGSAWQRLSEIQLQDGNRLAAEVSLTHALRCSSERAAELEPRWHDLGRKSLAAPSAGSPYLSYSRCVYEEEHGQFAAARTDAQRLLASYPGLGPALEIASQAAQSLHDYPQLIELSLDILERGWPNEMASARLRKVPREFFLPQDRVRWLHLDPRGSLAGFVRTLLSRGEVQAAALAARGGPAQAQPRELLPLLARVELEAGLPSVALETLAHLPIDTDEFRACTGLALRAALAAEGMPDLGPTLERVLASGKAEDPELALALDGLLAHGRLDHAESLFGWLENQSPPFLGELLLRRAAARLQSDQALSPDDDLERAASLLADGRPEFGRLVLAQALGDEGAAAREARTVLATPFGRVPAREIALQLLAGDHDPAATDLAARVHDGRDALLELVSLCEMRLAARTDPSPLDPRPDSLPGLLPGAPLSDFLLERFSPRMLLVLGLAAESPAWCGWVLARTAPSSPSESLDPWLRCLRTQAWLTLSEPRQALAELARTPFEGDSRLAWLRVRAERALGAEERAEEAELAWLATRPGGFEAEPTLAPLAARRALAAGSVDEARGILEGALERQPADEGLAELLAGLEDTSGRRTRSIELYTRLLARNRERVDEPRVLALLDVLRRAREEGEISESRWWAEVEALESERPQDPAPPRELAERSFQQTGPGAEMGRTHALQRLERLRARTLGRPLETLRPGEAERWIRLLAHYTPERAVQFAEQELRRDPSDPVLWRASAEALVAAGDTHAAIERLEALQTVVPDLETARLLALTSYQFDNDQRTLRRRLTRIQALDPRAKSDPILAFYGALIGVGNARVEGLLDAVALWEARARNGLARSDHGRLLALTLFQHNDRSRAAAALEDARNLAPSLLEQDVLSALGFLMQAAPAQRLLRVAPQRSQGGPDDAPNQRGGARKGRAESGRNPTGAKTPGASPEQTPVKPTRKRKPANPPE